MIQRSPLGKIFTKKGIVTEEQLEEALKGQSRNIRDEPLPQRVQRALILSKTRLAKEPEMTSLLGKILIDMGLITEAQLEEALKEQRKILDVYKTLSKDQLGAALEVVQILNSTLNISEVLPIIMKYVDRVTNSVASTLMLLDEKSGELEFAISTGPKADKLSDIRISPGEGIAGWVVMSGESALVTNVAEDHRFNPEIDKKSGFNTKSVLCVPLKAKAKILGVLEVVNKKDGTHFTDDDRLLLSIFAHQAAMAIENALFFSEKQIGFVEQLRIQKNRSLTEKYRALGLMASGLAKDFNELLSSIQGYKDLIKLDMEPSSPNIEKLRGIEYSVQKGAELTRRLLEFSRSYQKESDILNLNFLIEDTIDQYKLTDKKTNISTSLQRDIWNVKADSVQVKKVLTDICMNSSQAMTDGGDLYITTKNVAVTENDCELNGIVPGNYVKISIKDNGVGIAEPYSERIFDPFFTTREMGGGTGLGLTYASSVISNHGGVIAVQSIQNKGTTISILLPSYEKKIIKADERSERLYKGAETILFVDNDHSIIKVAKLLLESLGYNVFIARSGREAIISYKKNIHKIHMVILDLEMADMDGGATFENLKIINSEVKVLLTSGYDIDNNRATKMMDLGCLGFLKKPFTREQLSVKIRQVLDE
jgi:signal transduction histidine kinase